MEFPSLIAPDISQNRQRLSLLDRLGAVLLWMLALISLISLVLPTVVVVITSFDNRRFIGFPPQGFSLERYAQIFTSPEILSSATTSLVVATATVLIDLLLGVPAAIGLVRHSFPGKSLLLGFLQSPLMLPGIVLGIAILFFYASLGLALSLPLTILSHVVFTLPFVIRITMARMERADSMLEEAAQNLGANPWQVFRYVLLPYLLPGIVSGGAFAFLASFDNLTVSLFTAPVLSRTLPIELFYLMRFDLNPVVAAIATLQIGLTLVVLLVCTRVMGAASVIQK